MALVPESQVEMMDFCSYGENEMQFYVPDRLFFTKNAFPGLGPHPCSPQTHCAYEDGIQVKMARQASARNFRKAVILVVAVEKMRKSIKARPFTDDDLMDILNTVLDPVEFGAWGSTLTGKPAYQFSRAISFDIQDIDQKRFVLQEPAQLVALHLQGANLSHAVRLQLAYYKSQSTAGAVAHPIGLAIKGKELCLSCVKEGGQQPVLQLQKANILRDLDQSQMGHFLFNKIDTGDRHTRFESAAFPGWYICTSAKSEEAVGMTDQIGGVSFTDYELTR